MIDVKILHLVNRYHPAVGGGEEHVKLLAEKLTEKGHEVEVWTTNSLTSEDYPDLLGRRQHPAPGLPAEETINGVTVKRFDVTARIWSGIVSRGMFKELARINEHQFDLVHTHGYHITPSLVGNYYASKFGIPLLHTGHDIEISNSYPFLIQICKKLYDITIGRQLLKYPDRVIALTDSQVDQYSTRGVKKEKITVIPNAVNFDKFDNIDDWIPETIVVEDIHEEDFLMLYVGRIEEYKGIQDVIQAIDRLPSKNIKFIVVGEDFGYRDKLEQLTNQKDLTEQIVFTGRVDFGELTNLYRNSDIFILPSHMEGFGIVLLEAMYNGCVCIARAIPATSDIISPGENGYLFETIPELENQIEMIYNNPSNDLQELRESGVMYAKKHDSDKIVERIEETYGEIL